MVQIIGLPGVQCIEPSIPVMSLRLNLDNTFLSYSLDYLQLNTLFVRPDVQCIAELSA